MGILWLFEIDQSKTDGDAQYTILKFPHSININSEPSRKVPMVKEIIYNEYIANGTPRKSVKGHTQLFS